MIQDANPLTGNTNVKILEYGEGHVAFDTDSGLLYGSVQLPADIDADTLYRNAVGAERPQDYKEELQAVVSAGTESDAVPDNLLASARDVLNPDSGAQVLVTTVGVPSTARRVGRPDSVDIGLLHLHGTPVEDGQRANPESAPGTQPLATGIKMSALPAQGQSEPEDADALPPAKTGGKSRKADAPAPETSAEGDDAAPNTAPAFATEENGTTEKGEGE